MLRLSYSAETVLRRENLCAIELVFLNEEKAKGDHLPKAQELHSNPTNPITLILTACSTLWQDGGSIIS